MEIKSCKPYHGILNGFDLLKMPDGKSAFKMYYISVIGRDEPARYEWGQNALSKQQYENAFINKGLEGIGFVTAFPHITKVFRYCPTMETIMDVAVFDTSPEMPQRSIDRGNGFYEFACYAEAFIAGEEYSAWAKALSIDEYLKFQSSGIDFPVKSNRKMAEYWSG